MNLPTVRATGIEAGLVDHMESRGWHSARPTSG